MKHLAFIALSTLLTACGADMDQGTSHTSAMAPAAPEFTLACSAEESFAATVQSIRVSVKENAASLVIDGYAGSETFSAADSAINTLNSAALSASWADGTSFAAHQVRGRVFAGAVTRADGSTINVRCVRIVTSDRDTDEFSLVCAPKEAPAAAVGEVPDVPRELLLTYEEGELEMFVNPTDAVEIFDLELASNVRVTADAIAGDWNFYTTTFRATATGPSVFDGVLNYRGLGTYAFVCHKI